MAEANDDQGNRLNNLELRILSASRLPEVRETMLEIIDSFDVALSAVRVHGERADVLAERFMLFEQVGDELFSLAALAGFWASDANTRLWIELFDRMTSSRERVDSMQIRIPESWLPAHIALYHFGLAAVESRNFVALRRVLHETRVFEDRHGRFTKPLVAVVREQWGTPGNYFPSCTDRPMYSGGMSRLLWNSRLHQRTSGLFASRVHWDNAFLLFEGLLTLEIVYTQYVERGADFKRCWTPAGLWYELPLPATGEQKRAIEFLLDQYSRLGENSIFAKAGFGGGLESGIRLLAAIESGEIKPPS